MKPEITRKECSCNNKTLGKPYPAIFIKNAYDGLTKKKKETRKQEEIDSRTSPCGVRSFPVLSTGRQRNNRRGKVKFD